jgi:hypothetical protein
VLSTTAADAEPTSRKWVGGASRKWVGGDSPNSAARAPVVAPARPPRLNAAWNHGKIGRPNRRTTATAWTFIATSSSPKAPP